MKLVKKIKRWLDYNPPKSGTADEWVAHEVAYRKNAPIRFWLTETYDNYIYYPVTFSKRNISNWIRFRTYDKYHVVDTGLPPDYYDTDTIMLNVCFNLLKVYVEIEKASAQIGWNDDTSWKQDVSLVHRLLCSIPFIKRFFPINNRRLGMKYLEWEASLTNDNDSSPTHQAIAAKEIISLYTWWVDTRPSRVEVEYVTRELSEEDQKKGILFTMSDEYKEKYPDQYALTSQWYKAHTEQESQWRQEDEDMLVRLIKIRTHLWT